MNRLGIAVFAIAALLPLVAPFLLKPFGIYLISMWAVLTVAEKSCSFSPYWAPAETVPPAAGKNLRIDVASPALPASSRHNGTIPVIRCRRSSATIAAPSLRSSGTSRNTLSPASASEDAVEPGLITISPTLSATVRTAAISELFSGPTATWRPGTASTASSVSKRAARHRAIGARPTADGTRRGSERFREVIGNRSD